MGHDLGTQVAWHLGMFQPDWVLAVVALGCRTSPLPLKARPVTKMFAPRGDGFYITRYIWWTGIKFCGLEFHTTNRIKCAQKRVWSRCLFVLIRGGNMLVD